jgi:hypothetical protein
MARTGRARLQSRHHSLILIVIPNRREAALRNLLFPAPVTSLGNTVEERRFSAALSVQP